MDQNQNDEQNQDLSQSQVVGDEQTDDQFQDVSLDTRGDDQDQDNGDQSDDQGDDRGYARPSRQDRRIYKMTDNLRQTAQERDYYRDQLLNSNPDYKPLDYSRGQFDRQELEQDRSQFGTNQYVQGQREGVNLAKQELFVDRLEIDTERVASKFAVLDQDNRETFDPDLTSDINELYLETVGYDQRTGVVRNPNVRYKDFVEKYMRNLDRMSSSRNADTARNVARQSARQGIRPGARAGRSTVDPANPATWRDKEAYSKNKDAINATIMRQIQAEGLGRS